LHGYSAVFPAVLFAARRCRMDPTRGNDIPQEKNGRASHFTPLQHDDVASAPHGMFSRAMLRAYAESLETHKQADAAAAVPVSSERDDTDGVLVSTEIEQTEQGSPASDIATVVPVQAAQAAVRRRSGHRDRIMLGSLVALAGIAAALVFAISREVSRPGPVEGTTDRLVDIELATPAPPPPSTPAPPTSAPMATSTPKPAPVVSTQPRPKAAPPIARQTRTTPQRVSSTDGSLVVTSDPPGARVTVNGIGWGVTPVTIPYLPFGTKQVRLIKPGYESAERTLRLASDRPRETLRVTLRPRPVAKAPSDQQE
jgi:hypothetical protein